MVVIKDSYHCDKCDGIGRLRRRVATKEPQEILAALYIAKKQAVANCHEIKMDGSYYKASWRGDFLSLSASGYLEEIEVKISLADFKKDFKKERKHDILSSLSPHKLHLKDGVRAWSPNRFSYAVPSRLVEKVLPLLPSYAGLYEITYGAIIKKAPPFLHKEKDSEIWKNHILEACGYRVHGLMVDAWRKDTEEPAK